MVELLLLTLGDSVTPRSGAFMRQVAGPANLADKLRDARCDFALGELAIKPGLMLHLRLGLRDAVANLRSGRAFLRLPENSHLGVEISLSRISVASAARARIRAVQVAMNFSLSKYFEKLGLNNVPRVRKTIVAIIGGTVLLFGIVLIFLPGPSFLVIPAGLAILATEFVWAQRWLQRVKNLIDKTRSRFKTRQSGRRSEDQPVFPARQHEIEFAAVITAVFDADASAVRHHDFPRDGQSQSGARFCLFRHTIKPVENPVLIIVRDARPVI